MKSAAITGITGQLGSYLAKDLINKGYKVYGLKRRGSLNNTNRIDDIYTDLHEQNSKLELIYGDVTDYASICNFIEESKPDLFFNLAAMSHVKISFIQPIYTAEATGTSVLNCLEALRKVSPKTRFLTMSSSEMFGSTAPPQNEKSEFHPRSPYGCAKLFGYNATVNYREAYNMFASNAIAFNFESYKRSGNFVTKKITQAATRIKLGLQKNLYLGNLDAKRDWQHAADVAEGIYKIINHNTPDDFCLASGQMHTVRELCEKVFSSLDLDYKDYVKVDPKYFRESEVDALCGDSTKAKTILGWTPKYNFDTLISEMIDFDLKEAQKELLLKNNGY